MFNANAEVYRVKLANPAVVEKVAELGGATDPFNGLDDMTFGTTCTSPRTGWGAFSGSILRLESDASSRRGWGTRRRRSSGAARAGRLITYS